MTPDERGDGRGNGHGGTARRSFPTVPAVVAVDATAVDATAVHATAGDEPRSGTLVKFAEYVGEVVVEWTVAEIDTDELPGARRARCLLFTRQDCFRRVWDYPADWRTLDDEALLALSWHR